MTGGLPADVNLWPRQCFSSVLLNGEEGGHLALNYTEESYQLQEGNYAKQDVLSEERAGGVAMEESPPEPVQRSLTPTVLTR